MKWTDKLFSLIGFPRVGKVSSQAIGLQQPAQVASHMTADKIHSILRQAEAGQVDEMFALYRDILGGHSHLQTEFNTRKLAVLGDTWHFEPEDPKAPDDVRAAEACERLLKCSGFRQQGLNHLLNGCLYPVGVARKAYCLAPPNPLGIRYDLAELSPVDYHLLDYSDRGVLCIPEVDPHTGTRLPSKRPACERDFVVHRGHLLTMLPDHWGGPMRAALFWWLFAVQDRDWWVRFLDRFGAPFLVGKYNTADPRAKSLLTHAFSAATRLFGLVVSKETDIEVNAVATQSHGEAFEDFASFANRELSKLILGQTMTSEAQAQGIGGTQAAVHNMVRGDIRQFDASTLAQTVIDQIARQFLAINGLAGNVTITTGGASPEEIKAAGEMVSHAKAGGLRLTNEGITQFSKMAGLPFERDPSPGTASPWGFTRDPFAAAPRRLRDVTPAYLPSDEQLDGIAAAGAPGLAAAFRGSLAPVRRLIATSTSAEDLEAKLRAFYADYDAGRVAALVEEALTAYAANGAVSFPH